MEIFCIEDNTDRLEELSFAKVEIIPPNKDPFAEVEEWEFNLDERIRPTWFSPAHEDACWKKLREVLGQVVITEDIAELNDRKGLLLKDCVVGRLTGTSVVQNMRDSSVVQNMRDSSVVRYMRGTSVVRYMRDSSVVSNYNSSEEYPWMANYAVLIQRGRETKIISAVTSTN